MSIPEIFTEFRYQIYFQLFLNALIMIIGAILIPGNTNILMNARLYLFFLNQFIIYLAPIRYYRTWEKCWQYIKTDFLSNLISVGFDIMIIFFPFFIEILHHIQFFGSIFRRGGGVLDMGLEI